MNGVLLVRLARRSQALRSALQAIDEGSRELALVVHHLVQISKRHTQLRAELREMQGVIDEQDRALQVQRMLLARIRGAACPCERGRR
jgi:DNA repair exonuclease SbcCD ATPase subunit